MDRYKNKKLKGCLHKGRFKTSCSICILTKFNNGIIPRLSSDIKDKYVAKENGGCDIVTCHYLIEQLYNKSIQKNKILKEIEKL